MRWVRSRFYRRGQSPCASVTTFDGHSYPVEFEYMGRDGRGISMWRGQVQGLVVEQDRWYGLDVFSLPTRAGFVLQNFDHSTR